MTECKIAVISQPRYLPALNYLHRMILADILVYLDNVQYTPRDWENRNKIKGPTGASWLTVPVIHKSREQKISDTRIDNSQNWGNKHLKALQHNYRNAACFDEHIGYFKKIFGQEWDLLIDLNADIVGYVCDYLGIECEFVRALSLSPDGSGQSLLIDICKRIDADVYMSGSLGRNYITPENWAREGIGLVYHDYEYPEYNQLYGDFLPWMGCVDLLMNCGKESRDLIAVGNPTREELLAACA